MSLIINCYSRIKFYCLVYGQVAYLPTVIPFLSNYLKEGPKLLAQASACLIYTENACLGYEIFAF